MGIGRRQRVGWVLISRAANKTPLQDTYYSRAAADTTTIVVVNVHVAHTSRPRDITDAPARATDVYDISTTT